VNVGDARQIVTVAASAGATSGLLRAWQKSSDGRWRVVLGPYRAYLGEAGIGVQSEGSTRTPLGTFTLTEAFGTLSDPGTALPYHRTDPNDWWVSDVNSPKYNTLQNCARSSCPFNTSVSEHLYYITPYYNYAVVMDVNRWPAVPGKGSAFFLHVTDYQPTAGCVAIEQGQLLAVMRWLDPAMHPRIATGIG
jgi:L,D-peptidoglycan transpeptidase YkuD (ErfK/YbiS/YcfS/YnhG family)